MDSFLFLLRKCKSSSSSNVKGDIFVAASCHGSLPLSPFPPDNIDTKKIWLGPSKVCRVVGSSGSMLEGSLFHTPFSIECENKKVGWVGITFHVEFDRAARAARHPSGPPAMRGLVSRRVYDIDLHLGQTLTSRKENMHVISCWDTDLMPLGETGDFPSQNLPPKCRTITMKGLPPPPLRSAKWR